ncbi:hypothetical protein QTP88_014123 [Uroleucon formosanum]
MKAMYYPLFGKIALFVNLFEWHLLRIGVNGTNVVYNYSFFNMTFHVWCIVSTVDSIMTVFVNIPNLNVWFKIVSGQLEENYAYLLGIYRVKRNCVFTYMVYKYVFSVFKNYYTVYISKRFCIMYPLELNVLIVIATSENRLNLLSSLPSPKVVFFVISTNHKKCLDPTPLGPKIPDTFCMEYASSNKINVIDHISCPKFSFGFCLKIDFRVETFSHRRGQCTAHAVPTETLYSQSERVIAAA